MSLENGNGMGYNMNVMPAGYGNGGFGGGFGDNDMLAILILFGLFGGGFGGFGGGFGGYGMGYDFPWILAGQNNTNNQVADGFRDQMLNTGINGIQTAVTSGFGDVQTALCGGFAGVNNNICQTGNAITGAIRDGFYGAETAANARQMANMQQAYNLSNQFSECCCENRLAVANLGTQISTEAANTRAANQAGTQSILDKLCQMEMDTMRQNYENQIRDLQNQLTDVRAQVTAANNAASQTAQTARILADNAAQTVALEQYLNPTPIPAYPVQRPCCNTYA